tara:strand:+ start:4661 stop:5341 length:681 start_codon:yes stop_codon:yes gene_type:complete
LIQISVNNPAEFNFYKPVKSITMNTKIKELTENIYNDGIAKAREEADRILKEASQKAEETTAQAKARAESMLSQAKSESEKINASLKADLQATKIQVLEITRQEVGNLITARTAGVMAARLSDNVDFMKDMILEILKSWNWNNGNAQPVEALVPEKMVDNLEAMIQSDASDIMGTNLVVKPVADLKKGFQIVNDEAGFKISFTDEDFETFFASLMKPKIKEYLFKP